MPYADVAVDSTIPSRHTFTYSIPQGIDLRPGQMVYVPFGSRTLQGVVMEITESPAYPDTRDVIGPIEESPLISMERLVLAHWLNQRYLAPLFDCVALMLPPGARRRPLTFYSLSFRLEGNERESLTPRQKAVLTYIEGRGQVEQRALQSALRLTGAPMIAEQLVRRRLLSKTYALSQPRIGRKEVLYARLLVSPEQAKAITDDDAEIGNSARLFIKRLLQEGPSVPLAALRAETKISSHAIDELKQAGIIATDKVIAERDPLAGRTYELMPRSTLTAAQASAYRQIARAIAKNQSAAFLLHGVTGSGKTEVYLQALEQAVSVGKRAIVLVPEIALTPQTVRRFAQRFPQRVAVMHSALSLGEQYDQWRGISEGRYDVVIGARSALFAPQPDLGLIIIDEEHEWTYKQQDPAPRYRARDVAERLAELMDAVLLLGSATPSLETYHAAQNGRYRLLTLRERVLPSPNGHGTVSTTTALPRVNIVSMPEELKTGNYGIFSHTLARALRETLDAGEQAILFINRRGSASFVQCKECGFVPRCPSCAISLTYHAAEEALICHYCHRRRKLPERCPQCNWPRLEQRGFGTQRVEQEAHRLFPKARLLRWDRDMTRGRDAHERILECFLAHEADVLVGTQMVAKGLDMPLVTLVGVIAADLNLYLPDFTSAERTFQLLSQVAGRAGRGRRPGQVIVQTYTPRHYAIQAAASHDYEAFYRTESALRRASSYPPFGRLARLVFSHTNEAHVQKESQRMAKLLRQEMVRRAIKGIQVVGPTPAYVAKLRGHYRWQILLKGSDPVQLLEPLTFPEGWTIDIDPVSLL